MDHFFDKTWSIFVAIFAATLGWLQYKRRLDIEHEKEQDDRITDIEKKQSGYDVHVENIYKCLTRIEHSIKRKS